MNSAEKEAIDLFQKLPETPRAELADLIVGYAQRHADLTDKIQRGIDQLEAGQGIPAKDVFGNARAKYAN